MKQWYNESRYLRPLVHLSSLCYLAGILFIILHQQRWVQAIINKNFSINIQNVLLFFSRKNWPNALEERVRQLGVDLAILVGIQLIFCLVGLISIAFFFWRLYKVDCWQLGEKIVLLGYLALLISVVTLLAKMGNEAYQTYAIVERRITSMSVTEIRLFQEKFLAIFQQTNLSLDQLVPALLAAMEQLKALVQATQKIAAIPDLLQANWEHLLVLKNWLIGLSGSLGIVIVFGHLTAGIHWLMHSKYIKERKKRSKRMRQIDLDERLVTVIEQQEQLLAQLIAQNEAKQENEKKNDLE